MAEGQNLLRLRLIGLPTDRQEEVLEQGIHGNPDDPYLGVLTWALPRRIRLQRSDKYQE